MGSEVICYPYFFKLRYKMSEIKWIRSGSIFRMINGDLQNGNGIPNGIYEVGFNDNSGFFLTRTGDNFEFPYKIYDLQSEFIDHIKKTWDNTTGNLGILFNGIRGTGKTVTAKMFANMLDLPIIIVTSMGKLNPALMSYLGSFNFDCVFFFDEYEKQFTEEDGSILQFMDGIYSSIYRRVFLLTTNSLSVNENLLDRPSRVRYIKEFGNLEEKVVREYLGDNLNNKEAIEEVLGYIDTLEISTIDILKSICEEINIHGIDSFLQIKKFFNVSTAGYKYETMCATISNMTLSSYGIEKYDINMFLKELTLYRNRYANKDERDEQVKLIPKESDKQKFLDKWNKEHKYYAAFDWSHIESDKKWNRLIPGKDYFDGNIVVGVSVQHRVVICKTYYEDSVVYYYIKDEVNPSLYKNYDYAM